MQDAGQRGLRRGMFEATVSCWPRKEFCLKSAVRAQLEGGRSGTADEAGRGHLRVGHVRAPHINEATLDALRRGVGLGGTRGTRHTDFGWFFGSWVPDAEFDRAVSEI